MARLADHYFDSNQTKEPEMSLTIRPATTADKFAVRRLAVLDSASPPTGELLLAEMDGELWAALSVDTGEAVADPFRPSGDLVELLRFRVGHMPARAA
jgi:hypothetical protein